MSTYQDGPVASFPAAAALTRGQRVKINSSKQVAAAGVERFDGYIVNDVASGAMAAVRMRAAPGTFIAVANEAISAGAVIYCGLAGKVSDTQKGGAIGIALQAASGDGAIIEIDDQGGDPNRFALQRVVTAGEATANVVTVDTGFATAPAGPVAAHLRSSAGATNAINSVVATLGSLAIAATDVATGDIVHVTADLA